MNYLKRTVAVLVVGFASSASAATLNNGDFETGNLSGWTVTPVDGLTVVQDVVAFDTSGDGNASNAAHLNVGLVQPASSGGVSLSQAFTVVTAGNFGFSVDVAASDINGNASGGLFRLLIAGTEIDMFDASPIRAETLRSSLTGSLALLPGVYDFSIEVTRPFTTGNSPLLPMQYVDNASISVAAVPLPAGLPLMLAGLGAFAWTRRRQIA